MAQDGSGKYNGYDAPKYKVLERSTKGYELREYEETNWVATIGKTKRGMFWKLFRYIMGNNKDGSRIDMTVPVAIKFEPMETTPENITMHFFLPKSNNPTPLDSQVFLTSFPKFKVYVRRYTGFSGEQQQRTNLNMLKMAVGRENYNTDYYFFSGYDSPFKFFNRRNEVWLMAKQTTT